MKQAAFALTTVLSLVVIGAVLVGSGTIDVSSPGNFGTPRNLIRDDGLEVRVPLPEGPAERQLPVVEATTDGEYAFMFDDPLEGPVRYDPCRPVRWVLSTVSMPVGAEDLVHDAVADVSARTGLAFEYVGTTTEVPSFERPLFQDQYGSGFAPIVFGWSTASEYPQLHGTVTGVAGSTAVTGAFGDQRYLVSGVVVMDAVDIGDLMTSTQGEALARAVIMHEWAHVLGLAHVDDDTELMYESNQTMTTWGPGDLAGLAIVGAGPCQDV